MRCPDCGHVFDTKPEIVIQKQPCECGLETEARIARAVSAAVICAILALFGGCWVSNHYTTKAIIETKNMKSDGEPMPSPVNGEKR